MLLSIVVIQGPDQGLEIVLENSQSIKIGRGDQSDYRLNDPSVSRVHCEISRHGAVVTVRDLGSSSGTKINGQSIDVAQVAIGAKIEIGDSVLLLSQKDSAKKTTMAGGVEPTVKPLEELVGSKINSYRLDKVVGSGNSGVVFKAHDEEKQRDAAVKVLGLQHTRLPQQRERFVRAMKTMIPIRCDNIVRIYNAGITGPYCWTAMEFIEGENLAQLIDRTGIEGMLDWRKVWKIAADIAMALTTAQEHKIVHRNVTPTNILRRSKTEQSLLGDLMLAKALEGEYAVQITQPGQLMGDLKYMAPERTYPDGVIDVRSDIYGLGATCYALLTGQPPVKGENLAQLIENIRNTEPKAPRDFQLSINEHFQDHVLNRMLEKDPNQRFQSPNELLEQLERIGRYNGLA